MDHMRTEFQVDPNAGGFDASWRRAGWELPAVVVLLLVIVFAAFFVVSNLVDWVLPTIPMTVDVELGERGWTQLAPPDQRCTDAELMAWVDALAEPLIAQVPGDFPPIQYTVIDEEIPNAFALPGGFLTIHLGLIHQAESAEEVAAVFAHEIQHAVQRHGTKGILREVGAKTLLGILLGGSSIDLATYRMANYVALGYSRDAEREADDLGMAMLEGAGMDPGGLADFFERMEEQEALGIPTWMSTHPDHGERSAASRARADGFSKTFELAAPQDWDCRQAEPSDAEEALTPDGPSAGESMQ